ncbi:MAG TPA: gamma-glutamylcyclotransferase family protein [Mucilaginibacter sp.]|nr:gamma-glutamylcyclotransferase family protein [Mucilaginibacter sp.]
MNNLLFVYGTLLDGDNEYAIYLKNNTRFYAEGQLKGKLYDIGEYPGAVLSQGSDEYIFGAILQLNDPEKVLALIDDYEGFGRDQPYPNEFVRVSTEIERGAGMVICWVYLYNLPVTGLPWIKNDRYIK